MGLNQTKSGRVCYNLLKTKIKNIKSLSISIVIIFVAVAIIWVLVVRLEGEKPVVDINLPSDSFGLSQDISFTVTDKKSGLRHVWIGLIKDGKELVLLEKEFPGSAFISGGEIHSESFHVNIEPKKLGISDGALDFKINIRDYSWRGRLRGNLTVFEKKLVVDTRPPGLDVLTRFHNISRGGSGLIIYKLSEPCPQTGIYVGESFYPGYSGYFKDKQIALAFFALDHQRTPKPKMFVHAVDAAGNRSKSGFHHYIKKKVFRKDILNISDRFLSSKMPEFDHLIKPKGDESPVETFLRVNRDLRKANYQKIMEVIQNPEKTLYWSGRFLRLPNAARSAGFADHREYRYKGKKIDQQVHLGIDLASLARSRVPAANSGKVIFSDNLGIYGNTVVIDHGFGLFSMYSHLSEINVKSGQMVSRGHFIARTGSTGLAGGDHLHFSVLIHGTFVNPIEWWDSSWIENNVTSKIRDIEAG